MTFEHILTRATNKKLGRIKSCARVKRFGADSAFSQQTCCSEELWCHPLKVAVQTVQSPVCTARSLVNKTKHFSACMNQGSMC